METIAVIDIGSSAIRMLIAQGGPTDWNLLDNAELPTALGREVFHQGAIEQHTINRAVEILKGFQELMAPYGVDRIAAIGTSALRESVNREMFIDRVLLQTGIEVKVIDGLEANQLTWLAVRKPLHDAIKGFKRHNLLLMEVGAGHTDLMLLQKGNVSSAYAPPIGTLRFLQQIDKKFGSESENVRDLFKNHASLAVKIMSHDLGLTRISKLVAIGSDARLAAAHLGTPLTDEMMVIPREAFRDFMNEIEELSPEEIIDRLDLPWNEAELLYPALVIFNTFVESTRADEILVPSTSIRQGLLLSYTASGNTLREIFGAQVLSGARRLVKHYQADSSHAEFVRKQAVILYKALAKELGLKDYYRLFLETAALIHDVGCFIGAQSHHKHSQYIIHNSDIFGLSASDKEIVGHIVRYHRGAKPQRSHSHYMALSRSSRIVVQKLSALLRVSNALDRSHTQKIVIDSLEIKQDRLVISTSYPGDLALEELSLTEKGNMFEDVFGFKPILRKTNEPS